jgi:hypothetical protein
MYMRLIFDNNFIDRIIWKKNRWLKNKCKNLKKGKKQLK